MRKLYKVCTKTFLMLIREKYKTNKEQKGFSLVCNSSALQYNFRGLEIKHYEAVFVLRQPPPRDRPPLCVWSRQHCVAQSMV